VGTYPQAEYRKEPLQNITLLLQLPQTFLTNTERRMKLNFFRRFILRPSTLSMTVFLSTFLASSHLYAGGKPLLGINTNEVMQVDSSVPFINLFKQALPFNESRQLTTGNIAYDNDGWPRNLNGGVAGTNLIHWLPAGTIPEGNYTVLYDGEVCLGGGIIESYVN